MHLHNQRIQLRAPEPEDLETIYGWENNTGVWLVSETIEPFSRYQIKQYIENLDRDIYNSRQLRLMIEDTETNSCVGIIDMYAFEPFHQRAGIGILIGGLHRKQGYGVDALALFCNYAFNYLKLNMLYAEIPATNIDSIQLFENEGFECSCRLKQWRSSESGFTDVLVYQKFAGQHEPGAYTL